MNLYAFCRKLQARALGLRLELDLDALVVFHGGPGSAADQRTTSGSGYERTFDVLDLLQIVDLALGADLVAANLTGRQSVDLALVGFALELDVAAAPGKADAERSRAAGKLDGRVGFCRLLVFRGASDTAGETQGCEDDDCSNFSEHDAFLHLVSNSSS